MFIHTVHSISVFTLMSLCVRVLVLQRQGDGRDREHHAEEGCGAGAARRGARHRGAAQVGRPASAKSPAGLRVPHTHSLGGKLLHNGHPQAA